MDTIWESFRKGRNFGLVTEYDNKELYGLSDKKLNVVKNDDKAKRFFARDEWKEFEKHGEIIAQFMGADDASIKEAMEKMRTAFSTLGNGNPAKGFRKLNQLDNALNAANIDSLQPKIRVSRLLELLSPDYIGKITVPDEDGKPKKKSAVLTKKTGPEENAPNYEYNVSKFIDILLTRDNRKLGPSIEKIRTNGPSTVKFIDIFKSEDVNMADPDCLEIFRKIATADKYTKNNSNVGKGEIALSMFFGDCRMADDHGDVELGENK